MPVFSYLLVLFPSLSLSYNCPVTEPRTSSLSSICLDFTDSHCDQFTTSLTHDVPANWQLNLDSRIPVISSQGMELIPEV